jgi:hypothetical protein
MQREVRAADFTEYSSAREALKAVGLLAVVVVGGTIRVGDPVIAWRTVPT